MDNCVVFFLKSIARLNWRSAICRIQIWVGIIGVVGESLFLYSSLLIPLLCSGTTDVLAYRKTSSAIITLVRQPG